MIKLFIKSLLFSISLLSALPVSLSAQNLMNCHAPDPGAQTREFNIDIEHMLLEVSFQPEKGLVKGKATHTFRPLRSRVDSIFLDAPGIKFQHVALDKKEVKYKTSAEGITIYPESSLKWNDKNKHSLSLTYEATPRKGIYFIGWDDSTGRLRKQIWTQGQGIDNRYWIPSFDNPNDKLITELVVTIDKKYNVLSNGKKLAEKTNKDNTKTWHYRMPQPHALYLTMLGIGEYKVKKSKSKSGVAINNWYYPDQPEREEPTYRYTEAIMDFFEKETGVPYQWGSYSHIPVQNFLYGAMENTSATIFGDFFYVDKRAFLDGNYVSVNAHEMAHQWFGNLITGRNSTDTWLQESFATHYAKLAERHLFGEDHYQWNRKREQTTALNASNANQFPIAHTQAGSPRVYQKGSFVLDMLKYVIGEEDYRRVVTHYLKKHSFRNIQNYDFYIAFHDVLGYNLDWFFEQWVYRGGEPNYNVKYSESTGKDNKRFTEIMVDQVHAINELTAYFKMPIEVQVHYKDGSMDSKKEWVEKGSHVFRIPNSGNKEIAFILFDPNNNVLKKVTFRKPVEMLLAQAQKAPEMIDRYDALVALRSLDKDKKRDALIEAFNKETFHAIKSEIISQLVEDDNAKSKALLVKASQDKNAHVRLSVIQNIKTIPQESISEYEKMLTDSSYKVIENALPKLIAINPGKAEKYLAQTDKLYGMSNSLRITWLKEAYKFSGSNKDRQKEKYAAELADLASASFEFRTRINAMNALQSINHLDNNVAASLIDALLSNNSRLSKPASDAISYFRTQENQKALLERYYKENNWKEWQKEILSKQLH